VGPLYFRVRRAPLHEDMQHQPGFLTRPERTQKAVLSERAARRRRGCCPICARPMTPDRIDGDRAEWKCTCSHVEVALRGSKLFAMARERGARVEP
jgi:hypothetical protein